MTRVVVPDAQSVAELEEEIAVTRARISHRLATLDREYGLRYFLMHGARIARTAEFRSGSVAAMLRNEIVPVALIGAGLAWLLFRRKDGGDLLSRVSDGLERVRSIAADIVSLPPLRGCDPVPSRRTPEIDGEEPKPTGAIRTK